ncbi:MAG: porin family protein, partial [Saprospiraceae bacterium]
MTKSKLFLMMVFVGFGFSMANAQIGVRLGASLANQTAEFDGEKTDTKMKIGFGVGVFYQYNVNEKFSIQPELNFIQMGSKFDEDFLGETLETTLSFNYLHIPILAKYGFGDMEALNFYVQAGPY